MKISKTLTDVNGIVALGTPKAKASIRTVALPEHRRPTSSMVNLHGPLPLLKATFAGVGIRLAISSPPNPVPTNGAACYSVTVKAVCIPCWKCAPASS